MIKNWEENKKKCKEICEKNPKLLRKKETKGGFNGEYLTWTLVYKWMVKNYEFNFEVLEIKTSLDGSTGYVRAQLVLVKEKIFNEEKELVREEPIFFSQTLALSLETFARKNKEGQIVDYYQESPEALQMRVFVKLVANLTGFGFHLWER